MKEFLKSINEILLLILCALFLIGLIQQIIVDHQVLKMDNCIEVNDDYYCKVVSE